MKTTFKNLQAALLTILLMLCVCGKGKSEEMSDSLMDFIFPTSIMDGWHLSAYAGINQSWSSVSGDAPFLNKTNPAIGLSIGKYVTPVNVYRLQLLYVRNTGVYGDNYRNSKGESVGNWHFNSLSLGVQYLPNLTNLFSGYRVNRKVTFSAMAGICMERTFGYASGHPDIQASMDTVSVWAETARAAVPRWLVGIQAGVLGEYKYKDYLRFTLELTNTFLDDIYDGHITDQSWDGHFNLMAGVSYQLGWRPIKRNSNFVTFSDLERMEAFQNVVQMDTIHRAGEVIEEKVDVTRKVTYVLLSMEEGRTTVSRLQQANVYAAATLWNTYTARGHKSFVFITDAQKREDDTFKQRAVGICHLLSDRWQVKQNDIAIVADENQIAEQNLSGYENVIVITINEKYNTK